MCLCLRQVCKAVPQAGAQLMPRFLRPTPKGLQRVYGNGCSSVMIIAVALRGVRVARVRRPCCRVRFVFSCCTSGYSRGPCAEDGRERMNGTERESAGSACAIPLPRVSFLRSRRLRGHKKNHRWVTAAGHGSRSWIHIRESSQVTSPGHAFMSPVVVRISRSGVQVMGPEYWSRS